MLFNALAVNPLGASTLTPHSHTNGLLTFTTSSPSKVLQATKGTVTQTTASSPTTTTTSARVTTTARTTGGRSSTVPADTSSTSSTSPVKRTQTCFANGSWNTTRSMDRLRPLGLDHRRLGHRRLGHRRLLGRPLGRRRRRTFLLTPLVSLVYIHCHGCFSLLL